jgi:hypothetical protein
VRRTLCRIGVVVLVVLLMQFGSPPYRAAADGQHYTMTWTTVVPLTGVDCQTAQSQGLPCNVTVSNTISYDLVPGPNASIDSASTDNPNEVCAPGHDSCNGGSGTVLGAENANCGDTISNGTWTTSANGGPYWSNVTTRWHGVTCQSINWDSVDCSSFFAVGFQLDITWCGSWNDGAAAPWLYTNAGDNYTAMIAPGGLVIYQQGHGQRQGLDIYGHYGYSTW